MNNHRETAPVWPGYLRSDGRLGIRNLILVIYTVECAQFVAHEIGRDEPDVHVLGFPGCYDNAYAIRMMVALGRHPNVGAVLAVGLGCEYTQPEGIAEAIRKSGRPADSFFIQNAGGTKKALQQGREAIRNLRARLDKETRRAPMTTKDLVVGCECGGSDGTSGLAGNPVAGRCFDRLVDAGGIAVFEETVEQIGLREILIKRGANERASVDLAEAYDKAEQYCRNVRQWSASPGNFAGGLTTIEEKSLGAFAKSGSRPIQGVIKVAQQPPNAGLWLLDSVPDPHFMQFGYTNPNDSEGIMDLISVGCQIVLFVTGRGSVIGSPVAPLLKITGNADTFRRMEDDMDFDASPVLSGELSLDTCAEILYQQICRVAAGEQTKPEALGHREYFIPYKHQNTPDLRMGCGA